MKKTIILILAALVAFVAPSICSLIALELIGVGTKVHVPAFAVSLRLYVKLK